jgi:hypothetical protein
MVKWFVEEFIDQEVGLVIKTNIASNSVMDWEHLQKRMKQLLEVNIKIVNVLYIFSMEIYCWSNDWFISK